MSKLIIILLMAFSPFIQDKPIGKGKINTFADGQDVQRVNLWSSTNGSTRKINCFLTNNEPVTILKDSEPYYLVESINNKGCKGYCMKGFIKVVKK